MKIKSCLAIISAVGLFNVYSPTAWSADDSKDGNSWDSLAQNLDESTSMSMRGGPGRGGNPGRGGGHGGGVRPGRPGNGGHPGHGGGHGGGVRPGRPGNGGHPGHGRPGYHGPGRTYPGHGGNYPWGRWHRPTHPRPEYREWYWDRVRMVTCTSVDSYGYQYPVSENAYTGYHYRERLFEIQDAAVNRCFHETNGDQGCRLLGCSAGY